LDKGIAHTFASIVLAFMSGIRFSHPVPHLNEGIPNTIV